MPVTTTRLAVLIDADNTSPKHLAALLDELAKYGVATVRRAYGDWTSQQMSSWKSELNNHAVTPVQQFSYTTGKNATDSALIIDAMDLLYSDNLDAFALVSSDSDFTRLATRLRESGKTVYGLGLRKTPQSLVAACNKFIYLEVLGDEGEKTKASVDDRQLPNLRRLLTRAINNSTGDDDWARLSVIGSYLNSANADFDSRNYGYAKLINLVKAQDYLEVEHGEGHPARVRLRTNRPAKKASKKQPTKKAAKKTQSNG